MGGSFGIDDYFAESDGDEADDEFDNQMLAARRNDSQYHRSGSKDASDLGASLLLSVPVSNHKMIDALCISIKHFHPYSSGRCWRIASQ